MSLILRDVPDPLWEAHSPSPPECPSSSERFSGDSPPFSGVSSRVPSTVPSTHLPHLSFPTHVFLSLPAMVMWALHQAQTPHLKTPLLRDTITHMAGSENKVPKMLYSKFWFSSQQVKHTFETVLQSSGSSGKKMCLDNPALLFIISFAIFAYSLQQSTIHFLAIPQNCSFAIQFIKLDRLRSFCFDLHLV